MRKITRQAVAAFMSGIEFSKDNTSVSKTFGGDVCLKLHGNEIASKRVNGELWISNAGWFSTTTKERLNGIPGVSIFQRKRVWYLNGKEWDGRWVCV